MLRIAICDDELIFANELAKYIYQLEKSVCENLEVDIYNDGQSLCSGLSKGKEYDLVFLDIMMPEVDGIDVGTFIRKEILNNFTQIVYVSSDKTYAMELFKVRPMDFLIKPITMENVESVINTAMEIVNGNKKVLTYSIRGESYRTPIRDICYIISRSRKLIVHTNRAEFEFYGKIDDIEVQLKNCQFVRISKSCLVNFMYIKSIRAERVTMINGEELSVSRDRKDELRKICSMK